MKTKLVALALVAAACGGSPQPGDPGYSYNVVGEYTAEISAEDGSYFEATFQLETLPGGEITGTMAITNPMTIDGEVTGLLVGAEASLEMVYRIADAGCSGLMSGSAVIDDGGVGMAGSLETVEDDCDGPPSVTFTMTRNQ